MIPPAKRTKIEKKRSNDLLFYLIQWYLRKRCKTEERTNWIMSTSSEALASPAASFQIVSQEVINPLDHLLGIRWMDSPCPKSQTLLAYHLIAANATKLLDAKLMGNLVDTAQLY